MNVSLRSACADSLSSRSSLGYLQQPLFCSISVPRTRLGFAHPPMLPQQSWLFAAAFILQHLSATYPPRFCAPAQALATAQASRNCLGSMQPLFIIYPIASAAPRSGLDFYKHGAAVVQLYEAAARPSNGHRGSPHKYRAGTAETPPESLF